MNSLLINSIKMEYENSPLSLEEICNKNKVYPYQLGDTSTWAKALQHTSTPIVIEVLPITHNASSAQAETLADVNSEHEDAKKFKESLLRTAKSLVSNIDYTLTSTDDLSAKDIKDLAATLLSLKDAVIGKDPAIQVNLQQNNNTVVQVVRDMIKGYSDDC